MGAERKAARDLFRIGQRVVLTQDAIEHGIRLPFKYGKVLGYCRNPEHVKVLPEGRRTVGRYHVTFWRPA